MQIAVIIALAARPVRLWAQSGLFRLISRLGPARRRAAHEDLCCLQFYYSILFIEPYIVMFTEYTYAVCGVTRIN